MTSERAERIANKVEKAYNLLISIPMQGSLSNEVEDKVRELKNYWKDETRRIYKKERESAGSIGHLQFNKVKSPITG